VKGEATLWYHGDDLDAFAEAVRRVPYDEEDVCVTFTLSDSLSMEVSFFALTSARRIRIGDMSGEDQYLTAAGQYVEVGAIKGEWLDPSDLNVGATLAEYYGRHLQRVYECW
jgi:hypothetical protein